MIRREDLPSAAEASPMRDAITALINHHTPVVIVGLGTLGRRAYPHDTHIGYRLTLTAAVARTCGDADWTHVASGRASVSDARASVHADIRHLASAIGEQVEVCSPPKRRRCECGAQSCEFCGEYLGDADFRARFEPFLITVVKPR